MRAKVIGLFVKIFKRGTIYKLYYKSQYQLNIEERAMRNEYNNWHAEQSSMFIRKALHEQLKQVRERYRMRTRQNICLGEIIERLLDDDQILLNILNEIRNEDSQ